MGSRMTNGKLQSGSTKPPRRTVDEQPLLFDLQQPLPYGILDINPALVTDPGPPLRIRCVIRDCPHFLIPPTRMTKGDVCPIHGIRMHQSGTFSYEDPTRNFIVDRNLVARVIGHPDKFESHRLGLEKSEDSCTLCIFDSFRRAGCLNEIARLITGMEIETEPRLYLWGLDFTDESLELWPLLQAARRRFERALPVPRAPTEPDCSLFLDGHYLILCEVKLGSPNTFYADGPRKDRQSLTKDELLTIYDDPVCQLLDLAKARASDAVAYQMFRNCQFASYMAHLASPGTKPFFANLVRAGYEIEAFEHFYQIVRPEFADRVTRIRWEDLFIIASLHGKSLARLREYMACKTLNLQPAFQILGW